MEFVIYAIAGIVAVMVAIRLAAQLLGFTWMKTGFALTAIAVTAMIAPGAYAAEKASQFLANAGPDSDPRAIDKAREKVRADILRRADMFLRYPSETHNATRLARSFA